MPTDQPIACSLTATDLPQRLTEITDLGRTALVDSHLEPRRARLCFASERAIRERVRAIAAAEADCCAFLAIRVTEEVDTVVLTIDAPEGAEPVLAELVSAFRGGPSRALPSTFGERGESRPPGC